MDLQTERLQLRGWRDEDLPAFARINADPIVGRYLRGRPETEEETIAFVERIRKHWAEWGYGIWAAEHRADRRFLGFIGFSHHRWYPDEVEIGWRIDPGYWRQGLATEGAAVALQHGFNALGFTRLISIIHRDNAASRRVAEKIGLRVWLEEERPHPDTGPPLPICIYATSPSSTD